MITTPITLHTLDDENAVFVGTAEETFTRTHPLGQFEVSGTYPAVFIQRTMWEQMGRPTALMLKLQAMVEVPDDFA